MSQKSNQKKLKFGIGEYDAMDRGRNQASSILVMRGLFLSKANEIIPGFSDVFDRELMELYRQIPLFCFEADKMRLKDTNFQTRYLWVSHCRPTWSLIEKAWESRLDDESFYIEYSQYFDAHEGDGCWNSFIDTPKYSDPKITAFVKKLFNWSETFNLNESWCREHAFETIELWCNNPDFHKSRIWWLGSNPPYWFRPIPKANFDKPEFIFKYPTLYPSVGHKEEKVKINKEFKKQLDTFFENREVEARKDGLQEAPRKYELDHFNWLAMYQCTSESSATIAKKVYKERKTVDDGVKQVASTINLKLRDSLPSGPKRKE